MSMTVLVNHPPPDPGATTETFLWKTKTQKNHLHHFTYIEREVSNGSSGSLPRCSTRNRRTSRHSLAPHYSSAAHPSPRQTFASPGRVMGEEGVNRNRGRRIIKLPQNTAVAVTQSSAATAEVNRNAIPDSHSHS